MAINDELSTQECYKIIDQASYLKIFSISFAGAEPTNRADLVDIINYASSKGIYTALATNAQNLDANYCYRLKRAGLGEIAISIDSHDPNINDKNRGAGSLQKATAAISLLQSNNFRLSISVTLGDNNFLDIEHTVNYIINLKVPRIRIQFVAQSNNDGIAVFQLKSNQIVQVGRKISEIVKSGFHDISFGCSTGYLNYWLLDRKPLDDFGTCSVGNNILTINNDGKVSTCVQGLIPNDIIGDLKIQTLLEILNTPSPLLKKWITKNDTSKITNGSCANCDLLSNCKGGCKAMVFQKHNSFYFSDDNCVKNG